MCLWGCGGWLNCTRECECGCVWCTGSFCCFVCVTASQNTTRTPFTHHSCIPLRCHLSTPEAFPEHTTNKVGQVHGWALFLSESNFQEVPTGKRVPAASDNRTMTRSFPSPLTSAELNHMPQFSKSSAQPLHRTPQTCSLSQYYNISFLTTWYQNE